jgi:preprotein translocase subunit SecA
LWRRSRESGVVGAVGALEPEIASLSAAQLHELTGRLRRRAAESCESGGEPPDSLVFEALAAAREAGRRAIGEWAVDEQVLGAHAMYRGRLTEMRTGEGKTLAIALAAYLRSLEGKGVHVVTANGYLAARDEEWMRPLYAALAVSSANLAGAPNERRRAAYRADVLYATLAELATDYLRDCIAWSVDDLVQRAPHAVLIDEADLLLIDQARFSSSLYQETGVGPGTSQATLYARLAGAVDALDPDLHYTVDALRRLVTLTAAGIGRVEDLLGVADLSQDADAELLRALDATLCAKAAYLRDRDYVVLDGVVSALDRTTGRVDTVVSLPGELDRAIRTKEGLELTARQGYLGAIGHRHYLNLYRHRGATTGTALEDRLYREAYGLEIERIPTHRPVLRVDREPRLYTSNAHRLTAALKEIGEQRAAGRPVLVGTGSIAQAEELSAALAERAVVHRVLSAKNPEQEAEVIAEAGRAGAVTVVTRMAGRGVDIKLGGGPAEYEAVVRAGGLLVLALDLFETRRLEQHMRGRAGRRGDPGESAVLLALDDRTAAPYFYGITHRLTQYAASEDAVSGKVLARALRRGLDSHTKQSEQRLLEKFRHDDVLDLHRVQNAGLRRAYFDGEDTARLVRESMERVVERYVAAAEPGLAGMTALRERLLELYQVTPTAAQLTAAGAGIRALLVEDIRRAHVRREAELGTLLVRELERRVGMSVIDRQWGEHIHAIEEAGSSAPLHTLTGADWLTRYQQEVERLLRATRAAIDEQIVGHLFNLEIEVEKT